MIQANELRLGNLVTVTRAKKEEEYEKVVSLTTIGHKTYSIKEDSFIKLAVNSELNPIPLTEDILLKAGFEKNYDYCSSEDEVLYHLGNFCWNMGDISYNGSDDWFKCKYVHQLQNLYFALTGEELNIEL